MSTAVRTCVGCRRQRPQRELLRFRRRSDGHVALTEGRVGSGRSAYVCRTRACLDRAIASRSLQRSLARAGTVHCAPAVLLARMSHLLTAEEGG